MLRKLVTFGHKLTFSNGGKAPQVCLLDFSHSKIHFESNKPKFNLKIQKSSSHKMKNVIKQMYIT